MSEQTAAILFDPLNNADEPGCIALGSGPPRDDTQNEDDLGLGGPDDGIIDGVCPASCRGPFPRAIRPPRQRSLAVLGAFPFFEAYLRGRTEMRAFLEDAAAAENSDIQIQFDR